jgi:hypothetical protein
MSRRSIKDVVYDVLLAPDIERYRYTIIYKDQMVLYSNRRPKKGSYPHIIIDNLVTNRKWSEGCFYKWGQYRKQIQKRIKTFFKET